MKHRWCAGLALLVLTAMSALPAFSQSPGVPATAVTAAPTAPAEGLVPTMPTAPSGAPTAPPLQPAPLAWAKPPVEPGQRQAVPIDRQAVFLPALSTPPAPGLQPPPQKPQPTGIPRPPVAMNQQPVLTEIPSLPLLSQSDSPRGVPILVPGPSTLQAPTPVIPRDPTVQPHTAQGLPVRPAPVFPAPKLVSPDDALLIKGLFRGLAAVRSLHNKPQNDSLIRQVLGMGDHGMKLLRLEKFMSMPRFQSRYDETVLRDRSYDSWEYRRFGSFQTTLDGWIKTESLLTAVDWKFSGRGGAYVFVKGSLTKGGALSGRFHLDGSDSRRRKWHLAVEIKEVLLHDDGYPCAGSLKVSGWDPTGRSLVFALDFPCSVGVAVPFPHAPSRMNPSPIDRR